jgi:hypothetical protein
MPSWITWQGGWYSVKSVQGEKKKDRTSVHRSKYRSQRKLDSVTHQYVSHDEIHEQEEKFSHLKEETANIHALEGMPTLVAKRKGEIKL